MESISICFIGRIASESCINKYVQKCKNGFQYAAQNLQESIIRGLMDNNVDINVLSIPYLGTYPMGCKQLLVKTEPFYLNGKQLGQSLGYINFPFINQPSVRRALNYIGDWYNASHEKEKYLFVYGLHPHLMRYAVYAKEKYPNIKIVVIVPDLLDNMGANKISRIIGYEKWKQDVVRQLTPTFDYFVLLAEPMAEKLGIQDRHHIVMEGIFNSADITNTKIEKQRAILYTGNLDERYGIRVLLDAFASIPDQSINLWLRGSGSTIPEIEKRSKEDRRIQLIPPLSKEELQKLQRQATVLINPVSDKQDFTKYFFPSKTMDYMASGTPVLMYELGCLPEEYKQYLYFIKGYNAEDVANSIIEVINTPQDILNQKGQEASEFIFSEKMPQKQIARVIEYIKQN